MVSPKEIKEPTPQIDFLTGFIWTLEANFSTDFSTPFFYVWDSPVLWFTSPKEIDFPQSQKVALMGMAQLLSSLGYHK